MKKTAIGVRINAVADITVPAALGYALINPEGSRAWRLTTLSVAGYGTRNPPEINREPEDQFNLNIRDLEVVKNIGS